MPIRLPANRLRGRRRLAVALGVAVLAAAAVVVFLRPSASPAPTSTVPSGEARASDCRAAQASFRGSWDRSQQLDQQWRRLQTEYGPGAAESERANTDFVRARLDAARAVLARPSCFDAQTAADARAFLGAQGGDPGR